MATYALLPDMSGRGRPPAAVRDGFSWAALFFGPLAFAWRRMWLATVLWLCAAGAGVLVGVLSSSISAGVAAAFILIYVLALENAPLQSRALRRRGFALDTYIEAQTAPEARLVYEARHAEADDREETARRAPPSRDGAGVGLLFEGT
ncbi:MAG TPA: DUF2628 domain-containing protein [Beijerinckiaceae bacterium]|jgi:hypothetical protein